MKALLFALATCAAVCDVAAAQETVNYPSVSGRVSDTQGAAVPGAQVTTRHVETSVTADAVTERNFSNNFIVDGLSANDDAAGLSGIPYGVDAVDQFQVVTSGGQAELGRALGGYEILKKSAVRSQK
jgi:hypothetical protein